MMDNRNRFCLLQKINEISFAMDDTRLFLDTHKDCEEALSFYQQLACQRCLCVYSLFMFSIGSTKKIASSQTSTFSL